jgi:hypothetical protein
MSTRARRSITLALLTAAIAFAHDRARADGGDSGAERRALAHAVKLTSLAPGVRVLLIEPDLAPEPELLRRLDAFVVRERSGALRPIIYVNRQSGIVQRAAAGSDFDVCALAAVIHHEAQHLAGASEAEASRAELAFFQALIGHGRVRPDPGLRYLQLLAARVSAGSPSPSERE